MEKYTILHPVGAMNHECTLQDIRFEKVATVMAKDINEAFFKGQNDFNPSYSEVGVRSTSCGDIIVEPNGDHLMVMGMGFNKVNPASVLRNDVSPNAAKYDYWAQLQRDREKSGFGM